MNENPVVNTVARKTQVITLYDRQRRMLNLYDLPGSTYIALGKTTPWSDPNNADISDTYPPMPDEKATEIEEMIGMQRIAWKKFAKVFVSPTSEQKDDPNTVYYKGLYYETTNDKEKAIREGFTSVMFQMTADREQYFPIGVEFRQVGVYYMVDETDIYLTPEQYRALPAERRGHLAVIENFMPLTRQSDQLEKFLVCIDL